MNEMHCSLGTLSSACV